ncbi:conserved hypothetical protein [Culex quinquefasciatus]|uniref:Odorant receptor n=1 Tax=Culex quinquefasciatus TaxID=7176 RepID=B0X2P3_CULQU|nr:conserved hypothetical protein [Culex quinquefasciatus]|eukprot:XP_001863915.1 conserved hypothetical protein [Culex quinquefasciatus]
MEALDKFMQYTNYVRGLCKVLGMDVLGPNYKRNYRTNISFLMIAIYAILSINSFMLADSSIEMLKAISFGGFFCQCVLKIYFTLTKSEQYHENLTTIKKAIYLDHLDGNERQKRDILKTVDLLHVVVKGTTLLYFSSVILFSIYPAYMYFIVDVKVTIFPLYVPGVDIYSAYGYGFTNSIHLLLSIYGLFGALASDTAFIMFVFHIYSYTDLLMIEFDEFADKLGQIEESKDTKQYEAYCRFKMREILLNHKDIIAYLVSLNNCYQNISSVQVATCSVSICLNLFLALVTDWYATYGFLVASVFQLLVFSVLGTIIQLMNDRIIKLIYNLPWHLLPNNEKKSFCFLLFKSQRPIEILIRGLGPMNVETFTEIMKVIYQAFTMMYSFLIDQ